MSGQTLFPPELFSFIFRDMQAILQGERRNIMQTQILPLLCVVVSNTEISNESTWQPNVQVLNLYGFP